MGSPFSIDECRTSELGMRMDLRRGIGAEESLDLHWVVHPEGMVNRARI
jgi:hypothetical protein